MLTINGQLTIDSKINHGTTIKLEFPMQSFPKQFATQIKINTKHIVVAEDDFDIVDFWQEYVLFNTKNKDINYYLNFFKLKNYLSQNIQDIQHDDITFLLDYNIIGEKLTGIDIIKEFKLKNVYLITNYAEDIKLQDEALLLDIKLVPKAMLQIMLTNKAIITNKTIN